VTNQEFSELLTQKGIQLYRNMPWREDTRPYYVLVSELMLQQTQVSRVIPKFLDFITAFPDEKTLANAGLADVLKSWQGLGYNRRAKFLHEAAKKIVELGEFPTDEKGLIALPGVGENTAGAILAYSFNQPSIFIETNIRTVYIHHFFNDRVDVEDKEILEKLAETIRHEHPREFYWSLMDYGSWLKANGVRNISSSKQYKKQSPLNGSVREVRGHIVRVLVSDKTLSYESIEKLFGADRTSQAFEGLLRDSIITKKGASYYLTKA